MSRSLPEDKRVKEKKSITDKKTHREIQKSLTVTVSMDLGDQTRCSCNFKMHLLGMVSHMFNPSMCEGEAGEWILVYIHSESRTAKTTERLCLKTKQKYIIKTEQSDGEYTGALMLPVKPSTDLTEPLFPLLLSECGTRPVAWAGCEISRGHMKHQQTCSVPMWAVLGY